MQPSKGLRYPRHRKSSCDNSHLQQGEDLLQGAKRGNGRQASDPFQPGLRIQGSGFVVFFFSPKVMNKESGINHFL